MPILINFFTDGLPLCGAQRPHLARHFDAVQVRPSTSSMEIDPHDECDRAFARRVQAADQNADGPAFGRNSGHVVLGIAGLGPDRDAQSRWVGEPYR